MITSFIEQLSFKDDIIFSAGIDLFYDDDDGTQQYNVLRKALKERTGSYESKLRQTDLICLNGMLDGFKYKASLTFVVEKISEQGVRVGRTLSISGTDNSARWVARWVFPKSRKEIRKRMEEAFGDFLTDKQYEIATSLYLEEILGLQ